MRARYALIFGHGRARHELRHTALAQGLVIAAELPGLLLVTQEGTPVLKGQRAAAVGCLLTAGGLRLDALDVGFEAFALSDDPGALVGSCWGNFVLFATDDQQDALAYRDPSGSVGAFRLHVQGQDVFVSDAALALQLGLINDASPDLDFARHWLRFPFLKISRTGVLGASEMLAGTRHRRRGGVWASQNAWKPWDHARKDRAFTKTYQAVRELRDVALCTVPAQLRDGAVLLQLSGGLDSSIIAACLREAGRSFAAVHFMSASADGDERRYATQVAEACGVPLEIIHEEELELKLSDKLAPSFMPGANLVLAPIERAILERMVKSGADVLLDGGGGDNLFCYLTTAAPVLDALRNGPLGAGPSTMMSLAEATHSSWWEVAHAAARLQLKSRRSLRWKEDRSLLEPGELATSFEPHPWLNVPFGSLPGKHSHVETLVQIQHFFDRRTDWSRPVLHPLMAQPLLEICLRIPTWMWMAGGRDRAVARAAFEGLVPSAVLNRRMKGSLQGYFQRSFAKLSASMRDLLLGGLLVDAHIVDSRAIATAFARDSEKDAVQLRLSEIATLEQWLRSWSA